jgi:hypothetical protein
LCASTALGETLADTVCQRTRRRFETIVYFSIAVVIDVVAVFGFWDDLPGAGTPSPIGLAGLDALFAGAFSK